MGFRVFPCSVRVLYSLLATSKFEAMYNLRCLWGEPWKGQWQFKGVGLWV